MRTYPRTRLARSAAVLLLVLFAAAPTASAAVTFPRIPAAELAQLAITPEGSPKLYGDRIAALERDSRLAPVALEKVLADNPYGARPLCHPTHVTPALKPQGFCWQDGPDDRTNDWVPQGLSGSWDARSDGLVGGRRLAAVSWHNKANTSSRLSFVDTARLKYRHILLVEPVTGSDGRPNYRAAASHADGLVWYGTRLLVAQGNFLRVYDTRHIWRSSSDTGMGRQPNGSWGAAGYAYAMPQIAWYRTAGGWHCAPRTGTRPCFNSISLDHSGAPSMVSAEYVPSHGGRVLRWPLDPATGLPRAEGGSTHPTEGFRTPVWNVQGVVAHGGRYVMTGVCPKWAGVKDGIDHPSCLHRGVGGQSTSVWTEGPKNSQNLSYQPAGARLWFLGEQLRERVNIHVRWPY